jgi:3',5'-cyclic-AMP phosphodiesterase
MPLMLHRRAFLQGALASMAFARPRQDVRWALLSDIHISADRADRYRDFSPYTNLTKFLAQVGETEPDGLLISGDLARLKGLRQDYETLKSMLDPVASRVPCALALGNHDVRQNFFPVFARSSPSPVADRQILVIEAPPVRFIVLDSLMTLEVASGFLGRQQRTWLERYLQSSDGTPTVLFVHHPPDDGDTSLLDSDRLLRIVTPARQVKAVVFGHTHAYKYDAVDGLHLINLPAVAYNFADAEPVGWVQAQIGREGADLELHALGGNTSQNAKTKSLAWRG